MRIILINTNLTKPPIAPIGLEYTAEALAAAGHRVEICDLCLAGEPILFLDSFLRRREPGLVGMTLRNTDDCSYGSRRSFLGDCAGIAAAVRERVSCPVLVGGAGYSVMPETALAVTGADIGVWGDGEFAAPALAGRIERREPWHDIPNLVWRDGPRIRRNPASAPPLELLPPMRRRFLDHARYFREGGQGGVETKRGCPGRCVYCADPLAKGRTARLRPPPSVADEFERLLAQGVDHIHLCDSEFNIPGMHARRVCEEFIRRGIHRRARWYAYCSPAPFSRRMASLFREAGCAGLNFGADSGDPAMLARLRRRFAPADIANAVAACRESDIPVMVDLLLGSPGETDRSIARTVELMKRIAPDRVGIALGVRVYPGTELARTASPAGLSGGGGAGEPLYFMEPRVALQAPALVRRLTAGDERFLFFDPSRPSANYNYSANELLSDAVRRGYRGAYWDILRKLEEDVGIKSQIQNPKSQNRGRRKMGSGLDNRKARK